MKLATDTDGFKRWPYIAESRSDGDRNNGGIDLAAEPERISEIHEATNRNGLRPLLEELNSQGGLFMTLGCASGLQGLQGPYDSYLEFTHRDHPQAKSLDAVLHVHASWSLWLDNKYPDFAEPMRQQVVWEYRKFSLRGSETQYLIAVFHRAQDEESHCVLAGYLQLFLREFQIQP